MPIILEELKVRLAAAQARHLAAQQKFQAAQTELNAAAADFNVWNNAVNVEAREEAARASEAAKNQIPIILEPESQPASTEPAPSSEEGEEPINKTKLVRDLLLQNHGGMTPAAIWDAFHQQVPGASRNYLYSVLKRLRDKEEVTQRRGKYILKVKPIPAEPEGEKGGLFVN